MEKHNFLIDPKYRLTSTNNIYAQYYWVLLQDQYLRKFRFYTLPIELWWAMPTLRTATQARCLCHNLDVKWKHYIKDCNHLTHPTRIHQISNSWLQKWSLVNLTPFWGTIDSATEYLINSPEIY